MPKSKRVHARAALALRPTAVTTEDLARDFRTARKVLATLCELGHVRTTGDGRFFAAD